MVTNNVVKITNNGMISIPAALRKKYNLKDGKYVMVIEDEGTLRIIPIEKTEDLQKRSVTFERMLEIMKESRKEELELEK